LAHEQDDARASPIARANPVDARFLVAWGENDFPRITMQGPLMVEALSHAGVEAAGMQLPGASHFDTSLNCIQAGHPWTLAARELIAGMPWPARRAPLAAASRIQGQS